MLLMAAGDESEEESSSTDSEAERQRLAELPDGGKNFKGKVKTIKVIRDKSVPRDVYGWFEVTLRDVDVPAQTFDCSIEVHLFWQDFTLPGIIDVESTEFKLDDSCVPVKMSEIWENKLSHSFERDPEFDYIKDKACVYMMWVSDVTFTERLELQRFPLDRQFLNMQFNAYVKRGNWNWILKAPDWVPQEFHKKTSCARMTSAVTEYTMLSPWIDFTGDQPLELRLRIERLPGFYFGNIILPNFLIVLSCFACFAVPRDEVADRLSVSVTLMLSAVAFRFVVSDFLPNVPYLTWMDYYIIVGFVGLTVFILENAVAGIGSISENAAALLDTVCAGFFAVVWLGLHVFVTILLFHARWGRVPWEVMNELDKEEDEDAEFEFASPEEFKGSQPSEHCKAEWERYKMKPPETWARQYSDDHPHMKITLDNDPQN